MFLYLLDNDTSFVILASSGIGLLIEFWKITRAMDVSIDRSGSIPRLRFKDKASYTCALAVTKQESCLLLLADGPSGGAVQRDFFLVCEAH